MKFDNIFVPVDVKTALANSKRHITQDMSGHGLMQESHHEYSIIKGDPGILGKFLLLSIEAIDQYDMLMARLCLRL